MEVALASGFITTININLCLQTNIIYHRIYFDVTRWLCIELKCERKGSVREKWEQSAYVCVCVCGSESSLYTVSDHNLCDISVSRINNRGKNHWNAEIFYMLQIWVIFTHTHAPYNTNKQCYNKYWYLHSWNHKPNKQTQPPHTDISYVVQAWLRIISNLFIFLLCDLPTLCVCTLSIRRENEFAKRMDMDL